MLDNEAKKNLRIYGIFLGIFVLMTAILIVATLLSKNSKMTFLALDMQNVLDNYEPDAYSVGSPIKLESAFTTSAAAFSLECRGKNANDSYAGIIIRIPTIFGPMPAVFICKNDEDAVFAGYAVDIAKASNLDSIRLSQGILNYWQKNIPRILKRSNADERQ